MQYPAAGTGARRLVPGTAAMLLCISGTLLGAPPAVAHDGHATEFSPYFKPTRWTHGDCSIFTGPAFDAWHGWPSYHFLGGGALNCNSYHDIHITVRQYWDADGDHSDGVVELGDPGVAAGFEYSAFVHSGPACKGSAEGSQFQARVKVYIDDFESDWLHGQWLTATDGC